MIRLELQTTVKFRSSDYDRVLRLLRSEDEQPTLLLFVGADADALRAAANEVAKGRAARAVSQILRRFDRDRPIV